MRRGSRRTRRFHALWAIAVAVSASSLAVVPHPAGAQDAEVSIFLDEMASKHGFERASLGEAFDAIRFRPKIVELMNRQAKPKPWNDYRALFVNPQKLDAGVRFWRSHRRELALAEERYGVPQEVIVAILGIETHYGRNTGSFRVLDALATLAFQYPRRAKLFRLELEQFLLLTREESMPLAAPEGSYAGAMGIAQFMPGSYRRYAVDFDGDGERNLFDSPADAIGSVANYLTAYGWQRDQPTAVPAVFDPGAASPAARFDGAELSTRISLEELKASGVSATGAFRGDERVIPLTLRNASAPEYWLGFENFYVITRYNHSVYYAMAVHQLGRELRERAGDRLEALDR